MTVVANLSVTSGPDRGRSFDLLAEAVSVGRGSECSFVLSDETLPVECLTLLRRNGRFAVFGLGADGFEIDGMTIPPQRWVWLPNEARIRLSKRTSLQFTCPDVGSATGPDATGDARSGDARSGDARSGDARSGDARSGDARSGDARSGDAHRSPTPVSVDLPASAVESVNIDSSQAATPTGRKRRPKTARFITDAPGESLVVPAEDGRLPALRLADQPGSRRRDQEEPGDRRSWIVYAALAASILSSLAMLLIDVGDLTGSNSVKRHAREALAEYMQRPHGRVELQPYQLLLREAQVASTRGDTAAEHAAYRKVLQLLRAEGRNRIAGLTGGIERDAELERLIGVLLSP